MSELNPCPICGCSVRVWAKRFDEEGVEYIIECDNDFCGLTYGISCGYNRDEIKKAWNSVTALSPTVNEDCVSRQSVLDLLGDWVYECEYDEVAELVEKLPPVTPTVSEDCISRQAAIEAVCDGCKASNTCRAQLESLPSVEPKPVCEDAISKEWILKELNAESEKDYPSFRRVMEKVEDAPSVEPRRPKTTETMMVDGELTEIDPLSYEVGYTHGQMAPTERTGEWIDRGQCQVDEDAYDVAICSNCGAEITLEYPNDNFCPNCGADMRGEEK